MGQLVEGKELMVLEVREEAQHGERLLDSVAPT